MMKLCDEKSIVKCIRIDTTDICLLLCIDMLGDTEMAELVGAYSGMAALSQIVDRKRVSFECEDHMKI